MKKLVTISGPRCAGKETLIEYLMNQGFGMARLVNVTTRKPRPGEFEGLHYYFISPEKFLYLQENDLLACKSRIGEEGDPRTYWNGITKAEMKKCSIGIVDKAVESARKLEAYTDAILKIYLFAPHKDRLRRAHEGRNLLLREAVALLKKEPSPGERENLAALYPDFSIIENPDRGLSAACEKAGELVKMFLHT